MIGRDSASMTSLKQSIVLARLATELWSETFHWWQDEKCHFCREQLQQFAFPVGYEPVLSVRRPMVSGPTDDAGAELDPLAEIKSIRSPSGNMPMPTARLVAEVPSGQTNRPERLDDDVRLAGPYRCRPSPETGRRNSGRSPAPILPDLAP
jgi:hypothetical protein